MKLTEILNLETLNEGAKAPKKRPKKTLWFDHSGYWKNDLDQTYNGHILQRAEDEEQTVYSTDKDKKYCYGMWHSKRNRGVTFAHPRPYHSSVSSRARLTNF